jgi:hypothetical protein
MKPKTVAAIIMFVPVSCATVADGFTSAVGIAAAIDAKNYVAWAFAIVAGLATTGFSVATSPIWSKQSNWFLRFLWLIAIIVDVYTTVIGAVHFIIEKKWFGDRVNLSLDDALRAHMTPQAGLTFMITILIIASPISIPSIVRSLPE